MNLIFKKAIPHLIFIGIFLAILIIYFPTPIFEGKILPQNDVMQGIAAGQEAKQFRESTGEEALWTNTMFSGMPLYLINVYYSGDLIWRNIMNVFGMFPRPADAIFLSFVCFYLLLSVYRCKPFISFIGAFAYAFGTYNIISLEAGHMYKVWAIAFMPLVVAGIIITYRSGFSI